MLITFEGIDGSGKSTQVRKLKKYLQAKCLSVITLREPGGTEVAEKIRQMLLESKHDITPVGELLLFAASRAELVQSVILPALEAQSVVILDRFYDSTTAYQGYGRGISIPMLQEINRIATFGLEPDITFYLDILPEDAMNRKFSEKSLPLAFESQEPDRMERSGIEFYRRVRQGYLDLVDESDGRMVRLNALDKPEHIHKRVIQFLGKLEKRCDCGKGGCC